MRIAVRVNIPNDEGNEAIRSGKMGEMMGAFVQKWRPEALYFYPRDGLRGFTFYTNMDDASQMPALAEPFFEGLGAEIEMTPCMNHRRSEEGSWPRWRRTSADSHPQRQHINEQSRSHGTAFSYLNIL